MLGFRGCRLSVLYPEITEMQARAIFGEILSCPFLPSHSFSCLLMSCHVMSSPQGPRWTA